MRHEMMMSDAELLIADDDQGDWLPLPSPLYTHNTYPLYPPCLTKDSCYGPHLEQAMTLVTRLDGLTQLSSNNNSNNSSNGSNHSCSTLPLTWRAMVAWSLSQVTNPPPLPLFHSIYMRMINAQCQSPLSAFWTAWHDDDENDDDDDDDDDNRCSRCEGYINPTISPTITSTCDCSTHCPRPWDGAIVIVTLIKQQQRQPKCHR